MITLHQKHEHEYMNTTTRWDNDPTAGNKPSARHGAVHDVDVSWAQEQPVFKLNSSAEFSFSTSRLIRF